MSAEENKKSVRRFIDEVVNGKNLEMLNKYTTDDSVLHETGNEEYRGIDGMKKYFNKLHTAFPDMRVTIEDMAAEGDLVFTRYSFTGTHKGEMMGIPATGKRITNLLMNESRFKNGKYVETWQTYDNLGIMQQMGVAPPVAQAVGR